MTGLERPGLKAEEGESPRRLAHGIHGDLQNRGHEPTVRLVAPTTRHRLAADGQQVGEVLDLRVRRERHACRKTQWPCQPAEQVLTGAGSTPVPAQRGTRAARVAAMTRILVVDDDPGVRAVVTDALRLDGYEVEAVANGQAALGAMGRRRPAALVLDLAMPSMDGPTLVRTLREQTCWGRLPLVVLSGTPGVGVAGARLGARACLRKPFALPELVAAVERVAPADQA